MGRFRRPLLISLLAALGFYWASILAGDQEKTLIAVAQLDWMAWTLILSLSALNYLLRFHRWRRSMQLLGHRIPGTLHIAYYLAGFALTTTPGKAGEMIRSFYLKLHGVGYGHSLAAFFVERFMDLVAMLLLAMLAATAFAGYGWLVILSGAAIAAILPIVRSSRLADFLASKGSDSSVRLAQLSQQLAILLRASATLLRSRFLYFGLGIGVLAWGAEGIGLYIILDWLDVSVSPSLAVSIYAIAILAGALSFIPGGLGSTEAVMSLLLIAVGADPATAVAATLICRVATLWFAVAIGFMAMAVLEWCGFSLTGALSARGEQI